MTRVNNPWISTAEALAGDVLAKHADEVDREARWPAESIAALTEAGLLRMALPPTHGGAGQGPRAFATVTRILAEGCASTAMIYLMHVCASQVIAASKSFGLRDKVLSAVTEKGHLSTLAFSEAGSRSHFWAPVSRVNVQGDTVRLSAQKSFVTSAGHADSYVVSIGSANAKELTDSTLYYVPRDSPGLSVRGVWNGLGLRGNASAPIELNNVTLPPSHRLTEEGQGFPMMLDVVLPWFQLGCAAVSVGIARAATEGTRRHLLTAKFDQLGQSLASLLNLRARLAQMQVASDTQLAFLEHVAGQMENPGPTTLMAVLESKAAGAETALQVTDQAMRTCGGAAFGKRLSVERNFRDARAGAVMAPTTDVLYDFIARSLLQMPLL